MAQIAIAGNIISQDNKCGSWGGLNLSSFRHKKDWPAIMNAVWECQNSDCAVQAGAGETPLAFLRDFLPQALQYYPAIVNGADIFNRYCHVHCVSVVSHRPPLLRPFLKELLGIPPPSPPPSPPNSPPPLFFRPNNISFPHYLVTKATRKRYFFFSPPRLHVAIEKPPCRVWKAPVNV